MNMKLVSFSTHLLTFSSRISPDSELLFLLYFPYSAEMFLHINMTSCCLILQEDVMVSQGFCVVHLQRCSAVWCIHSVSPSLLPDRQVKALVQIWIPAVSYPSSPADVLISSLTPVTWQLMSNTRDQSLRGGEDVGGEKAKAQLTEPQKPLVDSAARVHNTVLDPAVAMRPVKTSLRLWAYSGKCLSIFTFLCSKGMSTMQSASQRKLC